MKGNLLINETSLYLLQHAKNPVNWEPWTDNSFKRAKEENKMVLVSIGYYLVIGVMLWNMKVLKMKKLLSL